MSRAKGNAFERDVAKRVVAVDGMPDHIRAIASSCGRVGHLDVGADIVTMSTAWECKNREDLPRRLWDWLAHISYPSDRKALVIKRNHQPALVLVTLDDFLELLDK